MSPYNVTKPQRCPGPCASVCMLAVSAGGALPPCPHTMLPHHMGRNLTPFYNNIYPSPSKSHPNLTGTQPLRECCSRDRPKKIGTRLFGASQYFLPRVGRFFSSVPASVSRQMPPDWVAAVRLCRLETGVRARVQNFVKRPNFFWSRDVPRMHHIVLMCRESRDLGGSLCKTNIQNAPPCPGSKGLGANW